MMPAHIEGQWKPAGETAWRPLIFGETLDIRILPPEGPQPIRWTPQEPLPDHAEHYHALIAPFMSFLHWISRH